MKGLSRWVRPGLGQQSQGLAGSQRVGLAGGTGASGGVIARVRGESEVGPHPGDLAAVTETPQTGASPAHGDFSQP